MSLCGVRSSPSVVMWMPRMELVHSFHGPLHERASRQSGSSFYLEVLLLVLAVLLMTVVLVVMLAHARALSIQAQRTTDATMTASDIAETYSAAASDADFVMMLQQEMDSVRYDEGVSDGEAETSFQGTGASVVASKGDATVSISLDTEEEAAGTSRRATIAVSYDGTVYETLEAARYGSARGGER